MSSGEARHGRRDNGLVAAEYAAVADVDPRVGEHLLDVLGLHGIAAYLRPSADLNPVTRSSSLPVRPTDRLYVDRAHVSTARDYVRRLAEEIAASDTETASAAARAAARQVPDPVDVDAAWAEIVAGFDLTAESPPRRIAPRPNPRPDRFPPVDDDAVPGHGEWGLTDWGKARETPGPLHAEPEPPRPSWIRLPSPTGQPRSADPEEPSILDGLDSFGAGIDDDEEGYTPPDAPPVPRPSMQSVLAVLGIVGGLVVFLSPSLLPMSERVAMLLGFTAVVSGFATLVWRLRPGDDEDEPDPDDGARV